MNFIFDGDIAAEYGIPEAVMLYNLSFWVLKNQANKQNYYNGRYWTYNSANAFSDLFPFLSTRTIQRVIKHLIDEGLIIAGNFSDDPRNRTNYYTLTDYGMSITTNCHSPLRQNGVTHYDKMEESILKDNSDSTDINNTDINIPPIIPRETANQEAMFEDFWKAYPKCFRKTNKKGCKSKFLKIENLEQIFPDIIASLEMQKKSRQWNEKDGQFIPAPLTWINQERWTVEDERTERQTVIEDMARQNFGGFLL